MWHSIYEDWALFSESNNVDVATLLTAKLDKLFCFLKLNFLLCINKLVILTPAKAPEVVGGDQHSCCPAINTKRCNFLYYSYNKVTLPYSFLLFFFLSSLSHIVEWNKCPRSITGSFCYSLYDFGDVTLPSEPVFLYHKEGLEHQVEYIYI